MKAMILETIGPVSPSRPPLRSAELPDPVPGAHELLVRVTACGVCHTELDEIEGRTPPPRLPVVPGHEVVGRVAARGKAVDAFAVGDRVGIGWIFDACGACACCRRGEENLCDRFRATGRDANGGYAEFMTIPQTSAFPIPGRYSDLEAAPFLCAGAIGYRSVRLTGLANGQRLGLTGFGASAHLVLKMVRLRFPDSPVYVFARNPAERAFARTLGAVWAGDTADRAPEALDCIIDTTPAWKPVIEALGNLRPGGRLVINAIRKEDRDKGLLAEIDYARHLWLEKEIKSVANVARRDLAEFLSLAGDLPLTPEIQVFALTEANTALIELKARKIKGAKVLQVT